MRRTSKDVPFYDGTPRSPVICWANRSHAEECPKRGHSSIERFALQKAAFRLRSKKVPAGKPPQATERAWG